VETTRWRGERFSNEVTLVHEPATERKDFAIRCYSQPDTSGMISHYYGKNMPESPRFGYERYSFPPKIQKEIQTIDIGLLSPGDIDSIARQVQGLVKEHNVHHPNKMYERTPEQLIDILRKDSAVVFADSDLRVAYFGMFDERLLPDEVDILGYQIAELGNSITNPQYRKKGLATLGTAARIEKARKFFGDNTILFATTENEAILRAYNNVNSLSDGSWKLEPVPFNHMPYFAGTTCIFSECGLDPNHVCSQVRRPAALSKPEHFSAISSGHKQESQMHCTLVVSDVAKAVDFQQHCIDWYPRLVPEVPVSNLTDGDLTGADIRNAALFFTNLRLFVSGSNKLNTTTQKLM
jgi:hypothetical protein